MNTKFSRPAAVTAATLAALTAPGHGSQQSGEGPQQTAAHVATNSIYTEPLPSAGTHRGAEVVQELFESLNFTGSLYVSNTPDTNEDLFCARGTARGSTPIHGDTIFAIGSVSKQFTAAAVLKLVENGELELESSVAGLLAPQIEDPGLREKILREKEGVTVRDLLWHTSGLNPAIPMGVDPSHKDQIVTRVLGDELRFEPGTRWVYNNVNYILLAAIVEEVSGKGFQEFVTEQLLDPAGLTATSFYGAEGSRELDIATGGGASKGYPAEFAHLPLGWTMIGCGGMLSTHGDLSKWAKNMSEVLSPEMLTILQEPNWWGYSAGGWYVSSLPGGQRVLSHTGSDRWGNMSFLAICPESGSSCSIFSNRDLLPEEVTRAAGLLLVGTPPTINSDQLLHVDSGEYRTENGDRLTVESGEENGVPILKVGVYSGESATALTFYSPPGSLDRESGVTTNKRIADAIEELQRGNEDPIYDLSLFESIPRKLNDLLETSSTAEREGSPITVTTARMDDGILETRVRGYQEDGTPREMFLLSNIYTPPGMWLIQGGRFLDEPTPLKTLTFYPTLVEGDFVAFSDKQRMPAYRLNISRGADEVRLEIETPSGKVRASQ